jgi:hypothetical protein
MLHTGGYPGNVLHLLLFQLGISVETAVMELAFKSYLQGSNGKAKKRVVDILEASSVSGGRVYLR